MKIPTRSSPSPILSLGVALFLLSCGQEGPTSPHPERVQARPGNLPAAAARGRLAVEPAEATLTVGETIALSVDFAGASGRRPLRAISCGTAPPGVLADLGGDTYEAVAPGVARVACSIGNGPAQSDTAVITVVAEPEPPVEPELRFVQQPTRTRVGRAISPPVTVEVVDPADGIRLTDFGGSLRMLVNTGPIRFFTGNEEFVDATLVDGIATWPTLQLDTEGEYQLWVVPADDAGGTSATPAFSETFTVFMPELRFVQQPTRTRVLGMISPPVVVEVVDPADGIRLTDFGGSLEMRVNTGPVTVFSGGENFVDARLVDGVATWPTLQLDVDGDYELWVVPADDGGGPSATPAFSETFTVFMPELRFVQQPTNTPLGEAISPPVVVEVVDPADGTRLTEFGPAPRMLVGSGPTSAFAGGAFSVDAPLEDGLATWTDLMLDVAGEYRLAAVPQDDGGPVSATGVFSQTFTVLPP